MEVHKLKKEVEVEMEKTRNIVVFCVKNSAKSV